MDAQARVAAAWGEIVQAQGVQAPGRIVVGHGGTGTLLMCRLVGLPITAGRTMRRGRGASGRGTGWRDA